VTGGRSQGRGGGLALDEGALTMTNVTVSGNSDPDEGGGLSLFGTVTLTNVTVSGNSTADNAGGIFVADGTTTLNNVTVSGNTADSDGTGEDGGGVWVGFGATLTLRNSLIAGNHDGSGGADHVPDCFNGATLVSVGSTLIGSTAGCAYTAGSGDVVNVDPMLRSLSDNGGTTSTHALRPGSPAANAGNGATCAPMDQRGAPRSGGCDIGAYEVVFCRAVVVNRVGTALRDALVGTPGKDGFIGLDGNDLLKGRGGQDALCGGSGKDKLRGGGGQDRLDGGSGRDLCVGQAGVDRAKGCERRQSI
jgi:Ca2+-binding RTX toxin-like protein